MVQANNQRADLWIQAQYHSANICSLFVFFPSACDSSFTSLALLVTSVVQSLAVQFLLPPPLSEVMWNLHLENMADLRHSHKLWKFTCFLSVTNVAVAVEQTALSQSVWLRNIKKLVIGPSGSRGQLSNHAFTHETASFHSESSQVFVQKPVIVLSDVNFHQLPCWSLWL